jgi:hypothetical protein
MAFTIDSIALTARFGGLTEHTAADMRGRDHQSNE